MPGPDKYKISDEASRALDRIRPLKPVLRSAIALLIFLRDPSRLAPADTYDEADEFLHHLEKDIEES